ncbi:LOW QUALITY PROTEIN: hypothetical protein MAR_026529 [Mya arenaria]|uniref:DDE Tnp4 domain-containing protein n=1 Tax=Mya arenaria TaxID=6604 RepID=A0ABY7EVC0_MYAAR|nr:LOW QUALITY PROTEIN: hypothetical protein MAR_026529 [Mya arenaria]
MPGIRLPFKCIICKTHTNPSNRRKINTQLKQQIIKCHPIEVKKTNVICNKCRLKYFYKQKPETNSKPENEINENSSDEEFHPPLPNKAAFASPPSVRLNIPSTPKSHSRCFICKRPGPKLIVVPSEARFAAFVQRNVIIKSGTRCCPVHMNHSLIKDEALKSVKAAESAYVNRGMNHRESCKKSNRRFDFTTLNNVTRRHIRNTPVRDVHTTVGIFFFKLKSGSWNTIQDAFISTKRCEAIRWVVESANARLKRWKYLDRVLPNSQVPFIGDYVKIKCAVCNKYLPPLSSSTDDDERQAQQMLQLVIQGNSSSRN